MWGRRHAASMMRVVARGGRPSAPSRRWMSAGQDRAVVSLERLAHKARVHLQVAGAVATHVEVQPALAAADFALRVSGGDALPADVARLFSLQEERVDAAGAIHALRITSEAALGGGDEDEDEDAEPLRVKLTLPHLVDLSVSVVNGSVSLRDKIEGDVKITVGTGDIVADKLRCVLRLSCRGGLLASNAS